MPMSLLKKVFFFFLAENKELLFSTGLRRMLSKLALELDFHFDLVIYIYIYIYIHTHATHVNINLSLITHRMDTSPPSSCATLYSTSIILNFNLSCKIDNKDKC